MIYEKIRKVKSHRKLHDAHDTTDLYTILGNDLADMTAKQITKIDLPMLQDASKDIFRTFRATN